MNDDVDVFGEWKKNRFIITDTPFTPGFEFVIVLTDIGFWNDNYEHLKDWCDEHLAIQQGMTVEIPNKKVLTLFCLRWA